MPASRNPMTSCGAALTMSEVSSPMPSTRRPEPPRHQATAKAVRSAAARMRSGSKGRLLRPRGGRRRDCSAVVGMGSVTGQPSG